MKCALELVTIATVRAEEIAREAEIRKQKERESKREDTLKMCERLGTELERQASMGKIPKISFNCSKEGRELVRTYNDYADKRLSYRLHGEFIDLELLAEWFSQLCFKVTLSDFSYYRYCWGLCKGYTVNIQPNPECLK